LTSVALPSLSDSQLLPTRLNSEIVVCIPAFNEGKTIGRVVRQSKTFSSHVLVCDDGSIDETSFEAASNGAMVAKHERNLGKGAALRTLLHEAAKLNPDVIVTLDGDGQHDPSEIPLLVAPVLEGTADVVIGSRFSGDNRIPLYRQMGNSVLTIITNWSAGTKLRDTQSGFRVYSSRVIPCIMITENGMGVDSEILVEIARERFRIEERNVSVSYSGDTSTFNPVSHIARVTWSLARGKYHSFGRISKAGGFVALASLVGVLAALGSFLVPFSLGLGVSALALSVVSLAVVLGPSGKLVRWIKKTK